MRPMTSDSPFCPRSTIWTTKENLLFKPPQKQLCFRTGIYLQGSHCACCFAEQKQYQQLLKHEEGTQPNTKHQNIGRVRFGTILTQDIVLSSTLNGIKIIRTFWFLQASFAFMFLITCLGLESSKGMPFNRACSSYSPSLKKSPTAYMNISQKEHSACSTRSQSSQSLRLWVNVCRVFTLEIRRTSMINGKSCKLFVISTIITHKETVILIEPPRNEAAPSRAYL